MRLSSPTEPRPSTRLSSNPAGMSLTTLLCRLWPSRLESSSFPTVQRCPCADIHIARMHSGLRGAVWKLKVYPKGHRRYYSSIYIQLTGPMADNYETLKAAYYIYLIDGAGSEIDSIERGTYNFGGGSGYSRPGYSEAMISYDRVRKALRADGSLLVAADVEFLAPDESALQDDEMRKRWVAKFSGFYGDDASSDCTIQVGGEAIPVHKLFLMANSPIFRRMFTNSPAEECKSGVVKVTDCKQPEAMKALIRYCYQGRLEVETMDGDGAVETFKLADRYCIADLKAFFEKHFIEKRLSAKNVIAMAVLADAHSAVKIASEGSAVFEIDEWKEHSDKELIAQVFQLAEKHSITGLKTQLEEHFIRKRLSVENVIAMAVLADKHSAEKLQEACTKLIAQQWKTVSASAALEELKKVMPELAFELAAGAATLLAEK